MTWESAGLAVPEKICSLVSFLLITFSNCTFGDKTFGSSTSSPRSVGFPFSNFRGSTTLHLWNQKPWTKQKSPNMTESGSWFWYAKTRKQRRFNPTTATKRQSQFSIGKKNIKSRKSIRKWAYEASSDSSRRWNGRPRVALKE